MKQGTKNYKKKKKKKAMWKLDGVETEVWAITASGHNLWSEAHPQRQWAWKRWEDNLEKSEILLKAHNYSIPYWKKFHYIY